MTIHKNNHSGGSSVGLPSRKVKETNRPADKGRYERFQCTQSTVGKQENEHKREND